tara:strand:- start:81 stop:422 length:342 start_codon:yes stop_codon:yes gene_type:complete
MIIKEKLQVIDYITPIKKQLDKEMHLACRYFLFTDGTNRESPRYFNIEDFKNGLLTISSTLENDLYFNIKTNLKNIDFSEFWAQFKEYRTKFLIKNYSKINPHRLRQKQNKNN